MNTNNEISVNDKLAELIIDNNSLLLLLEHFGIELPLQDLKVGQICRQYNINEAIFIAFANLYNGSTTIPDIDLDVKDALTIVKFLGTSHHLYSEQLYPEIMELIKQMSQLNDHKEMKLVWLFFADYFKEVTEHLDYENEVFHPYVVWLVEQITQNKRDDSSNNYSTIEYKDHHDDIEEKLIDLKNLLIKYLPLEKDQIVRRKLFYHLSQLEFDLKIHSTIEELILIPLTIRLENRLKQIQK